jgi:hypothetical protein
MTLHDVISMSGKCATRIVWKYQEQTTQLPKEKVQRDKQRWRKITYKTKDRVTRTPIKTGDELMFSEGYKFLCH